jgi:CP family cyanate transporter-like MFS transporter
MSWALQRGVQPPGAPKVAATQGRSGPSWHERLLATWRNPGTWWVALAFGAYSSQWMMVIGFMPTLLQAAGFGPFEAGLATAVTSLLNAVGNVMAGRLLQRGVAPRRVLSAAFVVMALGAWVTFGLAQAVPVGWRLLAVGLFSAFGGLIPGSLFMLAVRVAPNEHTVSTSLGWTTQMSMMGQFLVPPAAAALAQSTGGWHLTWLINVLACALGLLLVWHLTRRHAHAI